MPPSTSDELIDIQMPVGGMNTDTSPSQLAPQHAQLIHNYITGEPGQMRLRRGLDKVGGSLRSDFGTAREAFISNSGSYDYYATSGYSIATTSIPVGVAVFGDRALVTFADWQNSGFVIPGLATLDNPTTLIPSTGGSYPYIKFRTYIFDGTTLGSEVVGSPFNSGVSGHSANAVTIWTNVLPVATDAPMPVVWGNGVEFDDTAIFCTPMHSGVIRSNQAPLQRWAGAAFYNAPAALDASNLVGAAINNGAKQGTSGESANEVVVLQNYPLILSPFKSTTNSTATSVKEYYYNYVLRRAGQAALAYGATDFFITQPYGRGASTTTVPNEADGGGDFTAYPVAPIYNGPIGVHSINVFQGRLFTFCGGRAPGTYVSGTYGGDYYFNLMQWSTGNADEWPASNYAFIDDAAGSTLIGGGTLGDTQLIFSPNKTYIMSGYDENSFQIDNFSRFDGCIDAKSIKDIDGRLYWMGETGLFSWSGAGLPKRESHPQAYIGIRSKLQDELKMRSGYPAQRSATVAKVKDRLVFSVQDTVRAYPNHSWVYHSESGSYAKWGLGATDAPTADYVNYYFFNTLQATYAIGGWQFWNITDLFKDEYPTQWTPGSAELSEDEYWDTSAVAQTNSIPGTIIFRDLVVRPGRTARIQELQIEHGCQDGSSKSAVDVSLSVDPALATYGALKTLPARTTATSPVQDVGIYFSDRITAFPASTAVEGSVLRFKFDKPVSTNYRNNAGHKLYRAYAMMRVTRNFRIDSTAV